MKSPTPVSTPNKDTDLKATLDGLRSVLASASNDYTAARRAIEQLKREREEIACAPAHRDDLLAALMATVDHQAAGYRAALDSELAFLARRGLKDISETLDPAAGKMVGSTTARYFGSYTRLKPSGSLDALSDRAAASTGCLIAMLGEESIKTALKARVAALTIPNEGLPAAERQQKLADLDQQIERAEADLEQMRRTIEASGLRLAEPSPPRTADEASEPDTPHEPPPIVIDCSFGRRPVVYV